MANVYQQRIKQPQIPKRFFNLSFFVNKASSNRNIFQIEFEHEHDEKIAKTNPPDLYDNSTKLVYLDINESTWEIRSKVPSPGRYHIIVKFFQPNHPQFDVTYRINTDKSAYDGKLPVIFFFDTLCGNFHIHN